MEFVLLKAGAHGLFDGADVFVELDHQRVIIHTFDISDYGIVPLLCQRDEIVETVNPEKERWGEKLVIHLSDENNDLQTDHPNM